MITPLPPAPSRSDPDNFAAKGDALLGALATFVDEANATAAAMDLNDVLDVSASSVLIGTGAKTFAVSAGKSFQPGMYLVLADAAAPSTNSMFAQITSYTGTALVVNVISVRGAGTKAAWVISMTSAGGAQAGANSDITSLAGLTTPLSLGQGGTGGNTAQAARNALGAPSGVCQCVLTKPAANLVLMPKNGNTVTINGQTYQLPAAGVSLAATGLAANTAFYIYLLQTGGVLSLEASTTAHSADPVTGVEIKTGDATRTLVGQAATAAAATWATGTLLWLSYHNGKRCSATGVFTVSRTSSATFPTYAETHAEIRVPFLAWADDVPTFVFTGIGNQVVANGASYSAIAIDSVTVAEDGGSICQAYSANAVVQGVNYAEKAVAELTIHYATHVGSNALGNTSWAGAATVGGRCSLRVSVRG